MTSEQEDAIIGRALREYNESEKKMRILVAQAKQIGQRLCAVGEILQQHPFGVTSTERGFTGGDGSGASSIESFSDVLSYEKLTALEDEVRKTALALRKAREIKNSVC